jgi:hypothetical protein
MKQKPKPKNTRHSSDAQAKKLLAWAQKTVLGQGVKDRIARAKAKPHRFPGNTGILFDPNWQDKVLDLSQAEKDLMPEEMFVELQAKYPGAGLARGPR